MSVTDFIRSEVNANEILLFMKGTPTAPACGFSAQVVRILADVECGPRVRHIAQNATHRDVADFDQTHVHNGTTRGLSRFVQVSLHLGAR